MQNWFNDDDVDVELTQQGQQHDALALGERKGIQKNTKKTRTNGCKSLLNDSDSRKEQVKKKEKDM